MTWSASPSSSTIMARRSAARAPAAPARTSRTLAASPTGCRFPHYVLDYEARFAKAVMGDFADSYLQGETPVPCIACNQKIKFHDLLETAAGLGASALATGHYVRSKPGRGDWELYRAADKERDQSYFLFATTRSSFRSCASRSATSTRTRRGSSRGISDWASPRSPTARISASCPPAATRK